MEQVLVNPTLERRILDFRPLGFRDMAVLGRYEYTRAHQPLIEHSHGNMIEICFLASGHQNYVVEESEYSLRGGDVLLLHPHENHGSGANPEEKGILFWLLVHIPESNQRFLSLSPSQGQQVIQQLLQISPRHFKGNTSIKNTLNRIFTLFSEEAHPLRVINLQNLLLRFLLDLIACGMRSKESGPSPEIQHILTYIDQHVSDLITLSELAEEMHLSLSRFKTRFKKEVGVPPSQYIMRRKIERAKELLSQGRLSITQVAMQLEFSSSQYFSAVFKQYTRQTPTGFLKSHKSNSDS